jgi:dolichyl-diphosphooligosaccharide--protein glycosyltransferase
MVRLLPIRWGMHLSEFDPYFHFRSAEYMVEKGFFDWVSWRDYLRWYPFGHQPATGSYPGLAITAATLYFILNSLGSNITLFQLCVFFPVVMGTLTCLVMYFLGKDVGGKGVALFSSFFLALNSSYIGRTSLGFFDDETIGILGILLFFLFFLRSIEKERELKNSLFNALTAGLALGYVCTSWGASRYPIGVATLFVFILILLRRYSKRLLLSYGVSFGVAFFIAVNIPKLGLKFLTETFNLPVFGVFSILCLIQIFGRISSLKRREEFQV